MVEFIERRLQEGALSVSEAEIMEAILQEHPEFRGRAAYRHGLQRLHVRHVINAVNDQKGTKHYFIGKYPSAELRASLGL